MARIQPTIEAADKVASEFDHAHRQTFLVQAVMREHEGLSEADVTGMVVVWISVG